MHVISNNAHPLLDHMIYLYAQYMRGWQLLHYATHYGRDNNAGPSPRTD